MQWCKSSIIVSPVQNLEFSSWWYRNWSDCDIQVNVSSTFLNTSELFWQDDLIATLVQQCHQSQFTKLQSNYEEMNKSSGILREPKPAMIPIAVELDESPCLGKEEALIQKPVGSHGGGSRGSKDDMMDDLDEMIFNKKASGTSEVGYDTKK
ncbi:unnamed protein product [Ilex paraguariensis]|uniref:Uncharacterized protein n=1 Tax=Ilex paraguariensis TaxID=185542 RepID=A0ABC8T6G3_9AQUA